MSSRDKIQVKQVKLTAQEMQIAMKKASAEARKLVVWQIPQSKTHAPKKT